MLQDPEGSHYNRVWNLADEIAASFSGRTRNDRKKELGVTQGRPAGSYRGWKQAT